MPVLWVGNEFCWLVLCISRVIVTKACCLGSLQPMLNSIPNHGGCLSFYLSRLSVQHVVEFTLKVLLFIYSLGRKHSWLMFSSFCLLSMNGVRYLIANEYVFSMHACMGIRVMHPCGKRLVIFWSIFKVTSKTFGRAMKTICKAFEKNKRNFEHN